MAWKGLFQSLENYCWTIIMNSSAPCNFKLKSGKCTNCLIMFPLLSIVVLSVAITSSTTMTTLNKSSTSGSGSVHGIAIERNNANPSINGWGPMLAFNHIVEFFQKL